MKSEKFKPQDGGYGWVMVGVGAVCIGFGNGSLVTLSVFLKPLEADFGWSRGATSFAYLAAAAAMGLGGVLMGHVSDRFPPRRVAFVGALCLGCAYLLLSRVTSILQFYAAYVILGGLGAAAFFSPLIANVGHWFERRKGMALGIMLAGMALGNGLLPFGARLLISHTGWREAYAVFGFVALGLLVPLTLLIRHPGVVTSAAPALQRSTKALGWYGNLAWLSAIAACACLLFATALVHMVALAQEKGLPPQQATTVLTLVYMAGIAGSLFFGRLSDTIGGKRAFVIAAMAQALLVAGFPVLQSFTGLALLGVVFGLAYGGIVPCLFVCVRELIPQERQGLAVGIVSLIAWMGNGLGGYQGGFFYDISGGYMLPYFNAAGSGLVAVVLLLALRHRNSSPSFAREMIQEV